MHRRIQRAVCFLLAICLTAALAVPAQAATELPDSIYLSQTGTSTCTLCSAAMMIRARMYLNGNSQWDSVTESGLRSVAWISGMGLRWGFTYELGGDSVTVSHTPVSGMTAETLKAILDAHPEGIVLYCGDLPHAVFATDYEGDTFYCADPSTDQSGMRITLEESWLGYGYGSQAAILRNVTAYWYVSSNKTSGSGTPAPECGCSEDYAGAYICTAGDSLNIRSGHGTGYPVLGSIPSGAVVTVTKASGTGSSDWAHVSYDGVSGYVSMGYLEKQKTELTITLQPESVTVDEGINTEFTVYAKGDGLCYQWQTLVVEYDPQGEVISQQWQDLPGEGGRTDTLVISGTAEDNGSQYRCVITDEHGSTVTSETVTLTVTVCSCSTAYAGTYICTVSDWLRIRSGHGTEYSVIGFIPSGALVTVTKASGTVSGDWGHVTYDGVSGCVAMQYLKKQESAEPVPPKTYTVHYNANGGTDAPEDQIKIHGTALRLSAVIPSRDGWRFLGWADSGTDGEAVYQPGGSYEEDADLVLYAVWEEIVTEPPRVETTPMYRLYNPNSGEHFYTGSTEERDMLDEAGWNYEGVAWNAPTKSGPPVYRLYNPNSGDHHYTMETVERDWLVSLGWNYEGVAWNSAPKDAVPMFRLYNPNADCGSHHYTSSTEERDHLVSLGWIDEGIGWYGTLK